TSTRSAATTSASRVWPSPPSAPTRTAASGGTGHLGEGPRLVATLVQHVLRRATSKSTTCTPARATASPKSRPAATPTPPTGRSRKPYRSPEHFPEDRARTGNV